MTDLCYVVEREAFRPSTTDPNCLLAFASDLRISPGEWPRVIDFDEDVGNGLVFRLIKRYIRHGDLICTAYRQDLGTIELIIFND